MEYPGSMWRAPLAFTFVPKEKREQCTTKENEQILDDKITPSNNWQVMPSYQNYTKFLEFSCFHSFLIKDTQIETE